MHQHLLQHTHTRACTFFCTLLSWMFLCACFFPDVWQISSFFCLACHENLCNTYHLAHKFLWHGWRVLNCDRILHVSLQMVGRAWSKHSPSMLISSKHSPSMLISSMLISSNASACQARVWYLLNFFLGTDSMGKKLKSQDKTAHKHIQQLKVLWFVNFCESEHVHDRKCWKCVRVYVDVHTCIQKKTRCDVSIIFGVYMMHMRYIIRKQSQALMRILRANFARNTCRGNQWSTSALVYVMVHRAFSCMHVGIYMVASEHTCIYDKDTRHTCASTHARTNSTNSHSPF